MENNKILIGVNELLVGVVEPLPKVRKLKNLRGEGSW